MGTDSKAKGIATAITLALCSSCHGGGRTSQRTSATRSLPSAASAVATDADQAGAAGLLLSTGEDTLCIARGKVVYQWSRSRNGHDPRAPLTLDAPIVSLSCSNGHSCLATNEGDVWCFGLNDLGQLGVESSGRCGSDDRPCSMMPSRVPNLPAVSTVSAEYGQTCAVAKSGDVYCWGARIVGTAIQRVRNLQRATQVAVGYEFACAIDSIGRAWCWGRNDRGQLGRGTRTAAERDPQPISDLSAVDQIAVAREHACALSRGHIYCWGSNADRQLGTPDDAACREQHCNPRPHLVELPDGVLASALTLSNFGSCALGRDGAVYCWGHGTEGAFGPQHSQMHRDTYFRTPQRLTGAPTLLQALSYGATHTCGLTLRGELLCWGSLANMQFSTATSAHKQSDLPVCDDCVGPIYTTDVDVFLTPTPAQALDPMCERFFGGLQFVECSRPPRTRDYPDCRTIGVSSENNQCPLSEVRVDITGYPGIAKVIHAKAVPVSGPTNGVLLVEASGVLLATLDLQQERSAILRTGPGLREYTKQNSVQETSNGGSEAESPSDGGSIPIGNGQFVNGL